MSTDSDQQFGVDKLPGSARASSRLSNAARWFILGWVAIAIGFTQWTERGPFGDSAREYMYISGWPLNYRQRVVRLFVNYSQTYHRSHHSFLASLDICVSIVVLVCTSIITSHVVNRGFHWRFSMFELMTTITAAATILAVVAYERTHFDWIWRITQMPAQGGYCPVNSFAWWIQFPLLYGLACTVLATVSLIARGMNRRWLR